MLLKNWSSINNNCNFKIKTPTFLSWCFIVLFLLPFGEVGRGFAQVNLVPNPSFENLSSCNIIGNSIKLAIGWDTLRAGGGGGPEVFNACANPSPNFGVPINISGSCYQIAKTGVSYSLMTWYMDFSIREYIQTKLLHPLTTGNSYCVKFYVSLSNRSGGGIDELGAYFDDGSIFAPSYAPAIVNPQVKSPPGVFYTDTLDWMKVEGIYTATANDEYLTLGNFKPQAAVNYTVAYPSNFTSVEYYIEDVSVIDLDTKAYAGNDTSIICVGDSVFIGSNEIGLECEWFNNNLQIGTGAGIWVTPNTQQQYIVKQDVCGTISYDTVQVSIKDINCKPYVSVEVPNTFTPNNDGVNDSWQFSLGDGAILNGINIYNRWGNLIHQTTNNSSPTTVLWDGRTTAGEPCSEGVYFYVIKYADAKGEEQNLKGYISLFR